LVLVAENHKLSHADAVKVLNVRIAPAAAVILVASFERDCLFGDVDAALAVGPVGLLVNDIEGLSGKPGNATKQ
jgi:hypothetical protein